MVLSDPYVCVVTTQRSLVAQTAIKLTQLRLHQRHFLTSTNASVDWLSADQVLTVNPFIFSSGFLFYHIWCSSLVSLVSPGEKEVFSSAGDKAFVCREAQSVQQIHCRNMMSFLPRSRKFPSQNIETRKGCVLFQDHVTTK
ncbi:unnamed protein product [Boreogadus saida]